MILETNTLIYKPSEDNFQVCLPNCDSCAFVISLVHSIKCVSCCLLFGFHVLQEVIAEVIEQCKSTLMSVNALTGDSDFDSVIFPNPEVKPNMSVDDLPVNVYVVDV